MPALCGHHGIDRDNGSAQIAGVQMGEGDAIAIKLIGNAHALSNDPLAGRSKVLALEDRHIAAVAAALVDQPPGRSARLGRRDHL